MERNPGVHRCSSLSSSRLWKASKTTPPRLRYMLLDETRFPREALPSRMNLAAAIVELEQGGTGFELLRIIERLILHLDTPGRESVRQAFMAFLLASLPRYVPDSIVGAVSQLSEVRNMLAERLEAWVQSEVQKSWAEGKQEGRQEGRQETGNSLARRLLERRFGPLGDDALAALESVEPELVMEQIFEAETVWDAMGLEEPA